VNLPQSRDTETLQSVEGGGTGGGSSPSATIEEDTEWKAGPANGQGCRYVGISAFEAKALFFFGVFQRNERFESNCCFDGNWFS